MLELVKKKKKQFKPYTLNKLKHFPSSVREWKNSVYLYNKKNLDLMPVTSNYVMKIIKGFFSLYNFKLERKLKRKKLLRRLRKLSSNKIYFSNGEFKHNNNNVLINIYIYNRQKHNYLFKLKNKYLNKFLKKNIIKNKFVRLLKNIYIKGLDTIKQKNKNKYLFIKALNIVEKNKKYRVNNFKSLSNYTRIFYKKFLKLTMKKLRLFFLYKQLIYLNKSKLNYTYLRLLKKHLETIYCKNVEFNLINLKRFYLNSDILFESIKLKITKNKNILRRIFNKLWKKVIIRKKSLFLRRRYVIKDTSNKTRLRKGVLSNLKYRYVSGFRVQAKGRLRRRFTASRSVSKLKYRGNLLNFDSSYGGISSVILKGNLRSNLQYTKLKSKSRIGSFGLKGWVSGY